MGGKSPSSGVLRFLFYRFFLALVKYPLKRSFDSVVEHFGAELASSELDAIDVCECIYHGIDPFIDRSYMMSVPVYENCYNCIPGIT